MSSKVAVFRQLIKASSREQKAGCSDFNDRDTLKVLHITNWYPNPWSDVEGNFVRSQYQLFKRVTVSKIINVQVRNENSSFLRFSRFSVGKDEESYFFLTRFKSFRLKEVLTTFLLLYVLIRKRAWRYDVLHIHIAWPLLIYSHVWSRAFRVPIIISEHWSAYHFNFNLADDSPGLNRMRRIFRQGFPVIAVSQALLDDIRAFAGTDEFNGYVIPNVIPIRGAKPRTTKVPVLFTVNVWRPVKAPLPMLSGLAKAADNGARFELVIGGFGDLLEDMKKFVIASSLSGRTRFVGKMRKWEIADQLDLSDGYLFSSNYETFSVACAEALGAGVPLIGPFLPAISEYAGQADWEQVCSRDSEGWSSATERFLARLADGDFDRAAISAAAAEKFSHERITQAYLADALQDPSLVSRRRRTENRN